MNSLSKVLFVRTPQNPISKSYALFVSGGSIDLQLSRSSVLGNFGHNISTSNNPRIISSIKFCPS